MQPRLRIRFLRFYFVSITNVISRVDKTYTTTSFCKLLQNNFHITKFQISKCYTPRAWLSKAIMHELSTVVTSSVASPKKILEPNLLTLSEQQYFVWDATFQSTKQQDILAVLGACPFCPSLATPMFVTCQFLGGIDI